MSCKHGLDVCQECGTFAQQEARPVMRSDALLDAADRLSLAAIGYLAATAGGTRGAAERARTELNDAYYHYEDVKFCQADTTPLCVKPDSKAATRAAYEEMTGEQEKGGE